MSKEILKMVGLEQAALPAKVIEEITVSRGEVLFKPGDSCAVFLILIDGRVRVELTGRQGRDVVLYRIESGESCILTTSAMLNDEKYYAYGVAETDITAFALASDQFHLAMQKSPMFLRYVLKGYANKVSSIFRLVDRMTSKQVVANVASYLIENQIDGTVFASQAAIAREIGSAREVVGRKLGELEQMGIIQRGRSEIIILDKVQLSLV